MDDAAFNLSGEITLDDTKFRTKIDEVESRINSLKDFIEKKAAVKWDEKGQARYDQLVNRYKKLSTVQLEIQKKLYSAISGGREEEIKALKARQARIQMLQRITNAEAKMYEEVRNKHRELAAEETRKHLIIKQHEQEQIALQQKQLALQQQEIANQIKIAEAETMHAITNKRKFLTSMVMGIPGATPLGMGYMVGGAPGLFGAGVTAGAMALAGVTTQAIRFASELEKAQVVFTTILKSAGAAKIMLKDVVEFARVTPFNTEEIVNLAQYMTGLGFEAKEIIPILTTVGDAVSALGGGADRVEAVVRALGQMRQKSRVSAQEMNQLAEAGIDAWNMLAQALGITVPEAMKMAEQKMISAEQGIKAILDGMNNRYRGAMATMMNTTAGYLEQMRDSWKQSFYEYGSYVTPVFKELIRDIGELGQTIKPVIGTGLAGTVGVLITALSIVLKTLNLILKVINATFAAISNIIILTANGIINVINLFSKLKHYAFGGKKANEPTPFATLDHLPMWPSTTPEVSTEVLKKYRDKLSEIGKAAKKSAEEIRMLDEAIIKKTASMKEDIALMDVDTEYEKAKYLVGKGGELEDASKLLKEDYLKTARLYDIAKANKEVGDTIKSLTKDIKLFGDSTKYAAVQYEILNSNMKLADTSKIKEALRLAKQLDKLEAEKQAKEEASRRAEEQKRKQLSMSIDMQRDYIDKIKDLANKYINAIKEETNSVYNILKERFEKERMLEERAIQDKKTRYEKLKNVGRALVGAMTNIRMFDKQKERPEFDTSKITREDILSAATKYREDMQRTNELKSRIERTLYGDATAQLNAVIGMDAIAKYEEDQANLLRLLVEISNRQYQVLRNLVSPRVTGAGVVA